MGIALVCICWRALMEQGGLSFCLICRSFSNTRGREGAGCLRGAQGTYRLGGRSTAEGALVQKTSTSPVAFTKLQVRKRRKRAAAPALPYLHTPSDQGGFSYTAFQERLHNRSRS